MVAPGISSPSNGMLEASTSPSGSGTGASPKFVTDSQPPGRSKASTSGPHMARISLERITAVGVFAAADRGDDLARAVMDRIGDRLARIAVILASLLGVETVVVAGAIADAVEPVLERARTRIPALTGLPHPRLVASMHGSEVVVRGAIELALARLREDPLEYLDQG